MSPEDPQIRRGDLVMTGGNGTIGAVEVKLIQGGRYGGNPKNRRGAQSKKRRKIEERAVEYAGHLRRRLSDDAVVRAFVWTNEAGLVEIRTRG